MLKIEISVQVFLDNSFVFGSTEIYASLNGVDCVSGRVVRK